MELVRLDRLTLLTLQSPLQALLDGGDNLLAASQLAVISAPALDFNQAYHEFGGAVRRIGIYRGKLPPSDADDFVHEVFQRVWEKRSSFRGESTPRAWIIGIAYNVARNVAKRRRHPTDPDLDCDSLPQLTRSSPEERALQGEAEAQLTLAIAKLDEYEQRLFVAYLSTETVVDTARLCDVDYDKASRDLIAIRPRLAKILAQLQRDHGWRKR